jgi:hypothetical protein
MRLLALLVSTVLTATLAAADLSGVWTLDFDPDFGGERSTADCRFKQERAMLTIQCGSGAPGSGEVHDRSVSFQMKTGPHDELTAFFTASLDEKGRSMSGTWRLATPEKPLTGNFSARKQ